MESNPQNTLNFPRKAPSHLKSFVRIRESIPKTPNTYPIRVFSNLSLIGMGLKKEQKVAKIRRTAIAQPNQKLTA
ncbi:hypothetical protein ACFSAH_08130 [Pseudopedobacter beijingensis]|uniref:Uncharacterized protein n=1 Tax=Pseudopedobacter beijingensis TaxID=1207056 RepID=A0ABW4ICC2_9SPHI